MALVITIVGIVMATSVAQLGPALEHSKVRSAANVVSGDLQYAQVLAVRHRKPVVVIVAPGTKQYLIRDREDPSIVYRTRLLGQDTEYDLDDVQATPTSVELFPNGVNRETMTITLGLRGFERDVRMSRAGQIRVIVP